MRGQYKAAFIISQGTVRHLGECGWEFEPKAYLPKEIKKFLTDQLKLEFSHQDFGIDYYVGESIEASIDYGDSGNIAAEHVYIQVYNDQLQFLKEVFDGAVFNDELELFIPSLET